MSLIEEMVEVNVQQEAATPLELNPDVSRLLVQKRDTNRRRLEQFRAELFRILKG